MKIRIWIKKFTFGRYLVLEYSHHGFRHVEFVEMK